mgnify:CR=1 FL=1
MLHKYNFCFSSSIHLYCIKLRLGHKLTLKENLIHINQSQLPTNKISNIVQKKKKHHHLSKIISFSYNMLLYMCWDNVHTLFNSFTFFIQKNDMFMNLNYVLLTWVKPLNIIFRMERVKQKYFSTLWIRYVKRSRRNFLIWRWLSFLLNFYFVLYGSLSISFYSLFKELLFKPISFNKMTTMKLRAYKIYLYKLY